MSYIGGKARGSKHILAVLNDPRFDGYDYVEPFVGMAHVLRRVANKRTYSASDANPLVMRLLAAVQADEALPAISKERYAQLRARGEPSLERAVAAFQYSYNGREWGGYVSTYTRKNGTVDDIPKSRANHYAALRASPAFQSAALSHCDYRAHTPHAQCLVYCDPPYQGTTGYAGAGAFDHAAFWRTVRAWSAHAVVLVSEYAAPPDFACVASMPKPSCLAGGHKQTARVERLFVHESRRPLFAEPSPPCPPPLFAEPSPPCPPPPCPPPPCPPPPVAALGPALASPPAPRRRLAAARRPTARAGARAASAPRWPS